MSSNAANVKKVQGKLKELSVQISKMRKAVPKIGTKKDGQKLRIEIESIRDICSSSIKELTALLGITTDCKSKREALELNKTYRTKFVRDFGSLQKDFKKNMLHKICNAKNPTCPYIDQNRGSRGPH